MPPRGGRRDPLSRVLPCPTNGADRPRSHRSETHDHRSDRRRSSLQSAQPSDSLANAITLAARPPASNRRHTSVTTVLDRYGHLLPGGEERVTDALDTMARKAASSGSDARVAPMRR
jgi:hypothetical protein